MEFRGGGGCATHQCFKGELNVNAILPHLFTFQVIQKLYVHPVNLCCGVFCEFLGIKEIVFLEGDSFSRRIG